MSTHPRLRRLLPQARSVPAPEEWAAVVAALDADYRRLESERDELERSTRTLTTLLHRAQEQAAARSGDRATVEEQRAKKARRLRRALEQTPIAVFELTPDLMVASANPAAERLCGAEDLVGKTLFAVLEPADAHLIEKRWSQSLEKLVPVAETLVCSAGGRRDLSCDFVCVPRPRRGGKLGRILVYVRDETAQAAALLDNQKQEERYALAIAGGADALFDWDLATGKMHLSQRFRDIAGAGEWFDRVHPDDLPQLRAAISAHVEGRSPRIDHEHRIRDSAGEWRWVWARGTAIRDESGTAVRAVGLISDVTRHRTLVERMAHDARHDALTRLPNRTLFLDLLRHSFRRIRRHEDYRFAVLFIDIDDFKSVNDSLGHEAGDQLLVQIAQRLESCLRHGDTLARHAGDEFTMWLDDVRGESDALRVAGRVHEVMREPFRLGDRRIRSSASIGVAIGSAAYAQAEEVLRDADAAMYRAKALGKARTSVFEKSTGPEDLEADLRLGLTKGELRVLYMPIIDVMSGRVEGLEALARWQHPRLGLVPPSSFLALAERTGMIITIDRFMLETASRQLRDFRRDVPAARHTSMSINVSQKLLEQEGLAKHVDEVLRASRLEPSDLSFDISEGAAAAPTVLELHQRGLRVHMDDFGKDQSWLRHLHEVALDSVKIDRSFVTATAGADRTVLRHMVSIARELGKSVIAEGVETAEQLKMVRDVGCDAAQGFFFGAPLDAAEARALLESGPVGTA